MVIVVTNKEFIGILSSEELADAILNNDMVKAALLSPAPPNNSNMIENYTEIKSKLIQWLDSDVEKS